MKTTDFVQRLALHGVLIGVSLLCASSSAGFAQEGPPPKSIPAGYKLIEGDILVRSNAVKGFGPAAVYPRDPAMYWDDGIVPYMFKWDVSATNRDRTLAAMAEWEAVANVRFKPRSGEDDFVFIFSDGEGNWSELGRQGGQQNLSIVSWGRVFVIAHELGHTLGFWHEQSRSDRGNYIVPLLGNIQMDYWDQFTIHDEASHYGPYDFDSVMHYDQCAFSVDCCSGCSCSCTRLSILVLPPYDVQWQSGIGQRTHLSDWDGRIMSFLYPQSNWRFVDENSAMPLGTFLYPFPTFAFGAAAVPSGGTLWMLRPGNYAASGTHTKPMTIEAPLGGVTLR